MGLAVFANVKYYTYICGVIYNKKQMKDRINWLIKENNMNAAQFAASINKTSAIIHNILSGRNDASLDVVKRILYRYGNISPDWLLQGEGEIYRTSSGTLPPTAEAVKTVNAVKTPDPKIPFDLQDIEQEDETLTTLTPTQTPPVTPPSVTLPVTLKQDQNNENKIITVVEKQEKEIDKIVIFYTDDSIRWFIPDPSRIKN